MMIRLAQVFLLLLASAWLGVQLYHDPGYVLIAMNKWTIETTLGVAIPGLILLFLILHSPYFNNCGLIFFSILLFENKLFLIVFVS